MKLIENMIDWIAERTASLSAHQRMSLSARLTRKNAAAPGTGGFAVPLKTIIAKEGEEQSDFIDRGAELLVTPNADSFSLDLVRDPAHAAAGKSGYLALERHPASFKIYLSGDLDSSCGVFIVYHDDGRITVDGRFEDISRRDRGQNPK